MSLSRRRAWAIALMSCLTMAVSYLDRQTPAVLAPTITADLQISDKVYGWLAAAFSISYLMMIGNQARGRSDGRDGSPRRGMDADRVL
jgi:sugar phosphate permease